MLKRARRAIEAARDAFNVKEGAHRRPVLARFPCTERRGTDFLLVPKRVARNRKDGHVRARDDGDDDALLLDKKPNKRIKLSQSQSQAQVRTQTSPAAARKVPKPPPSDDSETEPEDDMELLLDRKPPSALPKPEDGGGGGGGLATPARSPTPDAGRAPGRIIGSAYPLDDFRANIASGDLVSKAVEDLAFVIRNVVVEPFAAKRAGEMVECARALRRVCLEEDEIEAWNEYVPRFGCVKAGADGSWQVFAGAQAGVFGRRAGERGVLGEARCVWTRDELDQQVGGAEAGWEVGRHRRRGGTGELHGCIRASPADLE